MSKQQTAVDLLSNRAYELFEKYSEGKFDRIKLNKLMLFATNQAKQMHKDEIVDAYKQAQVLVVLDDTKRAEQFYYETYESNGSDDHLPDVREMVEISDEEIIKLANEYILYNDSKRQWVIEGMKLYREQLKKK